jgi:hypothetical protein
VDTHDKTIPLPIQVQVQEKKPEGHPCHALIRRKMLGLSSLEDGVRGMGGPFKVCILKGRGFFGVIGSVDMSELKGKKWGKGIKGVIRWSRADNDSNENRLGVGEIRWGVVNSWRVCNGKWERK